MEARGTAEEATLKREDWLGSFAGRCGKEDRSLSISRTPDEGVSVVLHRVGEEDGLVSPLRFSGNRATGAVNMDYGRVRLELQLRGGSVCGI